MQLSKLNKCASVEKKITIWTLWSLNVRKLFCASNRKNKDKELKTFTYKKKPSVSDFDL